MKKSIYIPILVLIFPLCFEVAGQSMSGATRDSIFISALRDELRRSMDSLKDAEMGKPCFLSYSLMNGTLTNSEAILGALTESASMEVGDWYLRLMMGSFERNDENFVDPMAGAASQNRIQMACPIEPDYWSIRKAFWWNTDNVFRSAVKSYKNKLQAIKEFPLDAETEKLPDYTETEAVRVSYPGPVVELPQQHADRLVKELSAVFRNTGDIYKSQASVSSLAATIYIVNSEGSEIRIPLDLCMVNMVVQVKTKDEEIIGDNISFIAPLISSLPPVDTMKQAALSLGKYLTLLKEAEDGKEEYHGPVLLYDQALSNALLSGLFGNENSLIASRKPLVYNMKKSMTPLDKTSFESKLDKRIISKDLTITALPHLEQYDGIPLMGNTRIDAEGVVPPEEIVLVQDGVLKNLLCDRVPTPRMHQSNGHSRIGVRMGGFTFQTAPGVIKISASTTTSHDALKKQLISLAVEKGLEYAYIIKPLFPSANYSPLCYYRMDVNSGEEKLVKPLLLNQVGMNDLNKRLFACNKNAIVNTLFGSLSGFGSTMMDGIPISLIIPEAMVIEELSLNVSTGNSGYGLPELDER
jgi:hypothetical protein